MSFAFSRAPTLIGLLNREPNEDGEAMVALTLSVWYNYSMPLMVCCEAPRVVQGVVPGRLHCCRGETNENRSGVLKIHIKSLPNQMKSMTRRESLRPVAFLFSFEQRLLTRVQLASRGLIPARKLVPPAKCSSLQRGLPKYNEDTEPPMRGKFNHPPSATVYCHRYGSDGKLLTPLSCAEGKTGASIHRRALRPVLDFLVLAVLLLPLELWWRTREAECTDRSPVALVLLRATRGLWIVWLTHAAGLLDEALRMFLGIRLTQGLGTPTSVGKVDSKMSRRAEVVAEGIAVDDFNSLRGLYADWGPTPMKRASSGDSRCSGFSGTMAKKDRVNQSLVSRVDRVSAKAELWSFFPWSPVRRYDFVHVKGMTLQLRQVNGILNFSFLALKKKGSRARAPSTTNDTIGNVTSSTGENGSTATETGRHNVFGTQNFDGKASDGFGGTRWSEAMQDLDLDDDDDDDDYEDEDGEDSSSAYSSTWSVDEKGREPIARRLSEANSDDENHSRSSSASRLNFKSPNMTALSTPSLASTPGETAEIVAAYRHARSQESGGSGGSGGKSNTPYASPSLASLGLAGHIGNIGKSTPGERQVRSVSLSGRPTPITRSESPGNMEVFKVLGEAFMRRFNAYCQQVSAAFDRMSNIKLVPSVLSRGDGDERAYLMGGWWKLRTQKKRLRYEVKEVFLEDVCICVDAGVWNDLLGDHMGEAISRQFRLKVKVGQKELQTSDGKGRLAADIGNIVNDRLLRLLARLIMRETLKTSTITNMVLTSLALDTDARRRRQGKSYKSELSPLPTTVQEETEGRGPLARAMSAAVDAVFTAETKSTDKRTSSKFWRRSPQHGSTMINTSPSWPRDLPRSRSNIPVRSRTPGTFSGTPDLNSTPGLGTWDQKTEAGVGANKRVISGPVDRINGRQLSKTKPEGGVFSLDAVGGRSDAVDGDCFTNNQLKGSSENVRVPRKFPRIAKSKASWKRSSEPAAGHGSPSPRRPAHRLSRVRSRPAGNSSSAAASAFTDGEEGGDGSSRSRSWLGGGRKVVAGRHNTDDAVLSRSGNGDVRASRNPLTEEVDQETVAKAPPWLDDVQAHPEYEEMKPTLDVIKRTVLLAVLQQTSKPMDVSSAQVKRDPNVKQSSGPRGAPQGSFSELEEEMCDENKVLERHMHKELSQARKEGGDVDRLVMKALLARVRDAGPKSAYKALASIELSSFLKDLAAETRFGQFLEKIGVDVDLAAQSLGGSTAGKMIDGVRYTADKMGGEARRLSTEVLRVKEEMLEEMGVRKGGSDLTNISGTENFNAAGTVGLAVDGGISDSSPLHTHEDSWGEGVAVSKNALEKEKNIDESVESGADGNSQVDEVDLVLQVLELLDAAENVKAGVMNGDEVVIGKVEKAVGKVAMGIDIYLILAASESMVGFLLERLGKLPVGHAKFAGKGFESRVSNLDLEGVHVKRENVDLVMKGFRLPKRGTAVMTQLGPGKIKRYKKRSRCFVVNLDWKMGNGKPVKAYLQPNDIVVINGHERDLSDDDEETGDFDGNAKVVVENNEADGAPVSVRIDGGRGAVNIPSGYSNGAPSRVSKGKRRSLPKMFNRRRNTGGVETDFEGESAADDGKKTPGEETIIRTISVPLSFGSPRSRAVQKPNGLASSACTSPSTARTTPPLEHLLPKSIAIGGIENGDSQGGDSDAVDVEVGNGSCSLVSAAAVTSHPTKGNEKGSTRDDMKRGLGRRRDAEFIAKPTETDIMSAPFLVARISGVGAELKDVTWSVKQTHFPHLKTSGSMEATVSGLTIELELDTQELPHVNGRAPIADGKDIGIEGTRDRSPAGGGGGFTPKGLRLTRLRVSVRTVKVHVSNSALSAVYNLAASAFEVAVKRYVVENVEATVRKSLTTFLTIVNHQMLEKWDIWCKVSGGSSSDSSGSTSAAGLRKPPGNAIEKVLASSLSHHIVWAAGGCTSSSRGGKGDDTAAVAGTKDIAIPDKHSGVRKSSREHCVARSGSPSDSESGVKASEESSGGIEAKEGWPGRKVWKRSIRNRLMEAAGRAQSQEEMPRPLSSSAGQPASFTTTPAASCIDHLPEHLSSTNAIAGKVGEEDSTPGRVLQTGEAGKQRRCKPDEYLSPIVRGRQRSTSKALKRRSSSSSEGNRAGLLSKNVVGRPKRNGSGQWKADGRQLLLV